MRRNIVNDTKTGKKVDLIINNDGSQRIESRQDFGDLLKLNKQMNDDWRFGQMTGTQKHMAHVAEIPNVVYAELIKKFGKPSDNPKAWKDWLNNSENRVFRTGGGNL